MTEPTPFSFSKSHWQVKTEKDASGRRKIEWDTGTKNSRAVKRRRLAMGCGSVQAVDVDVDGGVHHMTGRMLRRLCSLALSNCASP